MVNSRNELLVGRRAFNPAKGMLDLPGGFVDAGESLEQAVVRELQEETGATVIPERWLFSLPNTYRYSGMDIPTVDSFFLCRLQDNADLHGQDDISSLFWHPLDRLRPDDFGMASVRHAIPLLRQRLEE